MSARNYAQTIGAGETATLPAGRYFFVRSATAALDIVAEGNPGAPLRFIGVSAGTKFGPVAEGQGWRFLRVTSATAQNVEIILSDDGIFDVANTVTVSGAVTVVAAPSTVLADAADANLASGAETTIAANLTRRRITIGVLSSSNNSVRVSQAGGAGRGVEIQPGMSQTFETTAAMVVRNDNTFATAAAATWYALEET